MSLGFFWKYSKSATKEFGIYRSFFAFFWKKIMWFQWDYKYLSCGFYRLPFFNTFNTNFILFILLTTYTYPEVILKTCCDNTTWDFNSLILNAQYNKEEEKEKSSSVSNLLSTLRANRSVGTRPLANNNSPFQPLPL